MVTAKNWNMTPRRFHSIVQEELSGDMKNAFVRMVGKTQEIIEYSLSSFFNSPTWMTKDDKIETLRLMTRVFQEVPLNARSMNLVFVIAGCLRAPGAFEVWKRASEKTKVSFGIFRHTFINHPRAVYAYLQLLEKVHFLDFFIIEDFLTANAYVEKIRKSAVGSGLNLHLENPTPEVMEYLKWGNVKLFKKFGMLENHIIALMHLVYGSDKLESMLHAFNQAYIELEPDSLVTALDNWDTLSEYPAQWIVHCLSLD